MGHSFSSSTTVTLEHHQNALAKVAGVSSYRHSVAIWYVPSNSSIRVFKTRNKWRSPMTRTIDMRSLVKRSRFATQGVESVLWVGFCDDGASIEVIYNPWADKKTSENRYLGVAFVRVDWSDAKRPHQLIRIDVIQLNGARNPWLVRCSTRIGRSSTPSSVICCTRDALTVLPSSSLSPKKVHITYRVVNRHVDNSIHDLKTSSKRIVCCCDISPDGTLGLIVTRHPCRDSRAITVFDVVTQRTLATGEIDVFFYHEPSHRASKMTQPDFPIRCTFVRGGIAIVMSCVEYHRQHEKKKTPCVFYRGDTSLVK